MKFYCTAGKGIERFAAEEIRQMFSTYTVTISTGKVFFELQELDSSTIDQLRNLKTVERIFVEAINEPVQNLDKRSLLTQLHCSLNNKQAWEECLEILQKYKECSQRATCSASKASGNLAEPPSKKQKTDYAHEATTFRVSCKLAGRPRLKLNTQKTSMQMAVLLSKLLGWKADPRHPQYEINVHLNDTALVVGIPLMPVPLSRRAYIRHCGLRSTVAAVMWQVLEIRPGDIVLDPMCGTSTILIEAARQHRASFFLGIDSSVHQLKLAEENIHSAQVDANVAVMQGDTTCISLPDSSVDRVMTDAPFGQSHVVHGDINMFYTEFLTEFCRVLKDSGQVSLLTCQNMVSHIKSCCVLPEDNHNSTNQHLLTENSVDISRLPSDESIVHQNAQLAHINTSDISAPRRNLNQASACMENFHEQLNKVSENIISLANGNESRNCGTEANDGSSRKGNSEGHGHQMTAKPRGTEPEEVSGRQFNTDKAFQQELPDKESTVKKLLFCNQFDVSLGETNASIIILQKRHGS